MTTDESLATIQRGQAARMIRGDTEELLIEREEDIIQSLVGLFRRGQLTDEQLRGSIGEIAGLRWFRESLESRIRQGVMTAEVELGAEDGQETYEAD